MTCKQVIFPLKCGAEGTGSRVKGSTRHRCIYTTVFKHSHCYLLWLKPRGYNSDALGELYVWILFLSTVLSPNGLFYLCFQHTDQQLVVNRHCSWQVYIYFFQPHSFWILWLSQAMRSIHTSWIITSLHTCQSASVHKHARQDPAYILCMQSPNPPPVQHTYSACCGVIPS